MALNETQKRNLSKLDLMEGSGIFTNNTKVNSVDQPTVIISLGGLGGKTLNALKKQIKSRVNQENNSIRLLAIDSADSDLVKLLDYGYLTKEETLSLYDPAIPAMAANRDAIPGYIKQWLNPGHTPSLTGEGCGGVRQNGRFILSVPAVYNKVRKRIFEVILSAKEAAPLGTINIIFVAGVSGGTGAGTFIDMAYIVQDIMKNDVGIPAKKGYKMSAYIFTPDVQFGCGANDSALMTNGYASFKELDYFYNIDRMKGVYKWPFEEGSLKDSKERIYDFCTLVSSYAAGGVVGKKREEIAISVTVESLMAIITNAELQDENGQPQQILSSFLDNYDTNVDQWMISGNGRDTELFPRSSNYRYNVIGYGTAKIPVDAIMSYIALKMYENVLEQYNNMNALTTEYISQIMINANIGDAASIVRTVKDAIGCNFKTQQIPSGGAIHGVKPEYTRWRDMAIEYYRTYNTTQQFANGINAMTGNIMKAIDQRLNLAFGEHGPYFVVNAITSRTETNGVDGILRRLDVIVDAIGNEIVERKRKINNTSQICDGLDMRAKSIPSTLGHVNQNDRDDFIRMAKTTIEKFTIDVDILIKMQEKLVEVRNALVEKNNMVFDVYTEVLDYIKRLLSKNSDLVVNSNRTANSNGGVTYSLDVVNLDAAQENGRRLKACVDSFITPEFLEKFKAEFEEILRDEKNRPAFTDSTDGFDATSLIQMLFDKLLGQFYQEAVERFLIAYYSDNIDMKNFKTLDAVMNNDEEKRVALEKAANAICKELANSAKPLCQIMGGGGIQIFAAPQRYMCCPDILYDVFKNVVPAYFPGGMKVCKRENAFSIDVVTNHIGLPLGRIHGMNDCDVCYDESIKSNQKLGLHLDESPLSDFKMLPAPFPKECWKFAPGHKCELESENVRKVEAIVKALKDFGILVADKKPDSDETRNARIATYFEAPVTEEMVKKFIQKLPYDNVTDKTNEAEYIRAFINQYTQAKEVDLSVQESGIVATLDNAAVIIRKDIELYKKLTVFVPEYKKLHAAFTEYLGDVAGKVEFTRHMTDFAFLMQTGIIKYAPTREWYYYDGVTEKLMHSFVRCTPIERFFHLYFAYEAYEKLDEILKKNLMSLANDRQAQGKINYAVNPQLKAEISTLYAPGHPVTQEYLLDREINRVKVNNALAPFAANFEIPLPEHNDYFELMDKFFKAFLAAF